MTLDLAGVEPRPRRAQQCAQSMPTRPHRAARAAAAAIALGLATSSFSLLEGSAAACAVCSSGVPVAPTESPAGRVTLTLEGRAGAAEVAGWRVDERRLELLGSYDFRNGIGIDAGLPALWRTLSDRGRAPTEAVSLGDVETRVRYSPWRTGFSTLTIFGGAKWPTAPVAEIDGAPLSAGLQPGCSSIVPLLGAQLVHSTGGWTFAGIGQLQLPFSIREAPHPGDSIRLGGTIERRLARWVSTRASLSLRLETGGELREGVPDPNTGGAVLYAGTEAVFRPASRFTLTTGLTFPVVQGWQGSRRETPVLLVSAAVSL